MSTNASFRDIGALIPFDRAPAQFRRPDMAGTRSANRDRAKRLLAEYRERVPGERMTAADEWMDEAAELLELIAGAP
jgi:hypothetical protein